MDYDVHYHAYNSQPHVFMLSQMDSFHSFTSYIKHGLVSKVLYLLLFCKCLNASACLLRAPIITINKLLLKHKQ